MIQQYSKYFIILKKCFKWCIYFLLVTIIYIIISLILSSITIEQINTKEPRNKTIYLNTNGVHLDIVLHKTDIDSTLLIQLQQSTDDTFFTFGWGDKDFYLNTKHFNDLTIANTISALFMPSPTLIHVGRYEEPFYDWLPVNISESELKKLHSYIYKTFELNSVGNIQRLEGKGYSYFDDFYHAKGSYYFYNTCNSWVNRAFKQSGLKSCLWTPFDFGLLNKYQ